MGLKFTPRVPAKQGATYPLHLYTIRWSHASNLLQSHCPDAGTCVKYRVTNSCTIHKYLERQLDIKSAKRWSWKIKTTTQEKYSLVITGLANVSQIKMTKEKLTAKYRGKW